VHATDDVSVNRRNITQLCSLHSVASLSLACDVRCLDIPRLSTFTGKQWCNERQGYCHEFCGTGSGKGHL